MKQRIVIILFLVISALVVVKFCHKKQPASLGVKFNSPKAGDQMGPKADSVIFPEVELDTAAWIPERMTLVRHPNLKLGGRTMAMWSLGEYANNGITSDSLGAVQSSDPSLQGDGAAGPGGTCVLISSAQKMRLAVNSLHNSGWLGYNGHPYFCGQPSTGIPYITGTSIYDGIQDSAGSSAHFFDLMAAGWNFQDGEQGWYVARDNIDSSLWICGDLQNGIRGNGTASANNMKWVKVPTKAGIKVIQIYSAFTVMVLCDTLDASGAVVGQRFYTMGVSGTKAADLGYGSPSFAQSAGSYNNGYNVLTEVLIAGKHVHNIRMVAGGLDCNYLLFDSLGVQRLYYFGQYGWRGNHSSSVSGDQVNTPADISARLATQLTAAGASGLPIDTIVVDNASTHILVGSGSVRRMFGWGSSEQGTLGNGAQLNFATYSPPYDDGGQDESLGAVVQFTAIEITPGKSNWQTMLNGGYYAYANQAMDQNGTWFGWGRNKPAYLPVGTKPIDGLAANLAAVQPQGWQRPYVTEMADAFVYTSPALSTSQGCFNASTPGPVTGSPCSLYSPGSYTTHAALSLSTDGTHIFIDATGSTTTATTMPYTTFSQTAGATIKFGIRSYSNSPKDTVTVSPGSYTVKVVVQDPSWGVDSTTQTISVSPGTQTGFYFKVGGLSSTCLGPSTANACPPTLFNTVYATEVAGDTNYLNRGDIFPIEIIANVSGASGNPIVTKPYGTGNLPIIGGRTPLTGWANVSGNVWQVPYTGPQPNILQHGDTILTQTTFPDLVSGWLTPTSMTTTQITDAAHSALVTIGSKIMIRSSGFTIDTGIVSNVSGGVITFAPAASFTGGNGGNGWKVMNLTPYENGQYQDTLGQIRVFSLGSPPGNWTIPTVDTPLLSEGTWQEWDSLRFQGGNNGDIILAFQLTSNNVFNADSVTDGYDGIQIRTEGALTVNNTVFRHFTNGGVWKVNNNNYNNAFINSSVYDAGMHPGMGRTGNVQSYSGFISGDSGSVVLNCIVDSVGGVGIASYGSGFRIDSNFIINFSQTLNDIGGVYTWIGSGLTYARQRKIINNIIINGGSPTYNLGTTLTGLAAGIYPDNFSNNILIQGNGINNVDYGIYDHGPNISFLFNVVLNARLAQQFFGEVSGGPTITGVVSKYNVFGYTTPGAYNVQLFSIANDLSSFGSLDSNYYLNPIGVTNGLFTQSSVDGGTNRTIASWRSTLGFDANTQYLNYAPLIFIASTTGASQPVYGISRDVYGNTYNGSATIPAYLSAILQRLSLPTLGPAIQGGKIIFH